MRLAVIGAGVMGANHVRTASVSPMVELVAVVDPDRSRTSPLTERYGVRGCSTVQEVLDEVEALVIATPTRLHHSIARLGVLAGKHLLIEKPITVTATEAAELIELADLHQVTLMVGHVERFNPAVRELPNVLNHPVHIEAFRIGPFSNRLTDDVVLDLMIHDIDLALSIASSPVASISAVGQRRRTETNDLVTALLRFENGMTASLTSSRIGQQKIRLLRVTQLDNVVTVDLLRQQIEINRVDHIEYSGDNGRSYRQTGLIEIPFVENRGEPLTLELEEFVCAVRDRRAPEVSARDGRNALAVALAIIEASSP